MEEIHESFKGIEKNMDSRACGNCVSRVHCMQLAFEVTQLDSFPTEIIRTKKVNPGYRIYRNGDSMTHLYFIRLGYVKVELALPNGHHQVNQFSIPGDLLGLDGIAEKRHALDATSLSDGEVCEIDFRKLTNLKRSKQNIHSILVSKMSRALYLTQEHLFSLANHNSEQKLAYFLIAYQSRLHKLKLQVNTIKLPMNREDLTSYLGMTSETLSRAFSYLEKGQYIQVRNRMISNVNYKKLNLLLEIDNDHPINISTKTPSPSLGLIKKL